MRSSELSQSGWLFLLGVSLIGAQCLVGCGSAKHNEQAERGGAAAVGGAAESVGGTPEAGAGGAPMDAAAGDGGGPLSGGAGTDLGFGGGGASSGGTTAGFPLGGYTGIPVGGSSVGGHGAGGDTALCIEGAPCSCQQLTGVTQCNADGSASCSCPPAQQCAEPDTTSCFEPCGGDPFGLWVVEDECYSGTSSDDSKCQPATDAQGNGSNFHVLFDDGGWFSAYGHEKWHVHSRISPACYGANSVKQCDQLHPVLRMFQFTYATSDPCQQNACGVCDCDADVDGNVSVRLEYWSREDQVLTIGQDAMNYCVNGDELWFGGPTANGDTRLSYKLRRQSCLGTPLPCEGRTKEQCQQSSYCELGACTTTAGGHNARCDMGTDETSCSVLSGCQWHADGCIANSIIAPTLCRIDNCDTEPGCHWGDPNPHCSGTPDPCSWTSCEEEGCTISTRCSGPAVDSVSCALLDVTRCAKAVGCKVVNNQCTGTTQCGNQTDIDACVNLDCNGDQLCAGTPPACEGLDVGACKAIQGCVWNW